MATGSSVLELTSQTVQRLETALHGLEAGRFGSCLDCPCRIGDARLRALPFAALCLACQDRHDLGGGARASHSTAGWKHRVAPTRIRASGH